MHSQWQCLHMCRRRCQQQSRHKFLRMYQQRSLLLCQPNLQCCCQTTLLEFQSVLVSANLQKYEITLADAGHYECDDLKEATTVELKELGMKTPEIRHLRKYPERMVELTASPAGLPSVPSSAALSVRSQASEGVMDCAGICALHSKKSLLHHAWEQ